MTTPALPAPVTLENVDRRILGSFACIDAITGNSVASPVQVSALQWNIVRNQSGVYVIFDGPGFNQQSGEFIPTGSWTDTVQLEVTLQDPAKRYLSRRATLKVPFAIPASPTTLSGVFVAQPITLYPSPAVSFGPNWAVIHVSVTASGTTPPRGLPWAIVQVVQSSDKKVLATGQSDYNGEALLAVIGLTVQASTSTTGPVTVSTTPVTVTAYFNPSYSSQPSSWIPNPDDIVTALTNADLASSSQSVQLSSGQELSMSFALTV